MPRKDLYHDELVTALKADGWTITHDPYYMSYDDVAMYIDVGAEKLLIGAESGNRTIAVEVKNFVGQSDMNEFQKSLGQYLLYVISLEESDPERIVYLAFPEAFERVLEDNRLFRTALQLHQVKSVIFNVASQTIVRWNH